MGYNRQQLNTWFSCWAALTRATLWWPEHLRNDGVLWDAVVCTKVMAARSSSTKPRRPVRFHTDGKKATSQEWFEEHDKLGLPISQISIGSRLSYPINPPPKVFILMWYVNCQVSWVISWYKVRTTQLKRKKKSPWRPVTHSKTRLVTKLSFISFTDRRSGRPLSLQITSANGVETRVKGCNVSLDLNWSSPSSRKVRTSGTPEWSYCLKVRIWRWLVWPSAEKRSLRCAYRIHLSDQPVQK